MMCVGYTHYAEGYKKHYFCWREYLKLLKKKNFYKLIVFSNFIHNYYFIFQV